MIRGVIYAQMGTDHLYPVLKAFEPTSYQMLMVYLLFTITAFLFNALGNRLLPLFTKSACLHSPTPTITTSIRF